MKKKIVVLLIPVLTLSLAAGCGVAKNQSDSGNSRSAFMEAVRSANEEAAKKASALATLNAATKPASSSSLEAPKTSSATPKSSSATPAAPASQEYPTAVDGIGVRFCKSINDDVTGKWRVAIISDSSDLNAYVVDFYKAYIKDSSELLGIVNHDLKTTTCVRNFLGDWLDISVHQYQPGEENNAKLLFGGKLLDNYWINMTTGEINLLEDD